MKKNKYGYPEGNLKEHSNAIHRQIAYSEIYLKHKHKFPLPFGEYKIHHIDTNKQNFSPNNLYLCSQRNHEKIHTHQKEVRKKFKSYKEIEEFLFGEHKDYKIKEYNFVNDFNISQPSKNKRNFGKTIRRIIRKFGRTLWKIIRSVLIVIQPFVLTLFILVTIPLVIILLLGIFMVNFMGESYYIKFIYPFFTEYLKYTIIYIITLIYLIWEKIRR